MKVMRILISDASAIVRAIIEQNLKKLLKCESVNNASGFVSQAFESAERTNPDLVICDKENGLKIAEELNIPVIVLTNSSEEIIELKTKNPKKIASVLKPDVKNYTSQFFEELCTKIKELVSNDSDGSDNDPETTENSENKINSSDFKPEIVCFGASTGGPGTFLSIIQKLGENFPLPVLYAQHVEIGADQKMADWFSDSCQNIKVKLAEDGEEAVAGKIYMAPADKHLVIDYINKKGNPVLKLSDEDPERFLRPAVNKTFESAARIYGSSCLAILLTGMGQDGANGCKKILEAGGYTICEDKSTCVVFGMPAAAIKAGGASEVLPKDKIAERVLQIVNRRGV